MLKRLQFGKRSERLDADQMSLFDEAINADLAALEAELEQLQPATPAAEPRQQPKRAPLPSKLPRTDIHHEPEDTTCQCGCQRERVGKDISEKLDYAPAAIQTRCRCVAHLDGDPSASSLPKDRRSRRRSTIA